jgi:hypothetical protein
MLVLGIIFTIVAAYRSVFVLRYLWLKLMSQRNIAIGDLALFFGTVLFYLLCLDNIVTDAGSPQTIVHNFLGFYFLVIYPG